jgi:hypothetical protein
MVPRPLDLQPSHTVLQIGTAFTGYGSCASRYGSTGPVRSGCIEQESVQARRREPSASHQGDRGACSRGEAAEYCVSPRSLPDGR